MISAIWVTVFIAFCDVLASRAADVTALCDVLAIWVTDVIAFCDVLAIWVPVGDCKGDVVADALC